MTGSSVAEPRQYGAAAGVSDQFRARNKHVTVTYPNGKCRRRGDSGGDRSPRRGSGRRDRSAQAREVEPAVSRVGIAGPQSGPRRWSCVELSPTEAGEYGFACGVEHAATARMSPNLTRRPARWSGERSTSRPRCLSGRLLHLRSISRGAWRDTVRGRPAHRRWRVRGAAAPRRAGQPGRLPRRSPLGYGLDHRRQGAALDRQRVVRHGCRGGGGQARSTTPSRSSSRSRCARSRSVSPGITERISSKRSTPSSSARMIGPFQRRPISSTARWKPDSSPVSRPCRQPPRPRTLTLASAVLGTVLLR